MDSNLKKAQDLAILSGILAVVQSLLDMFSLIGTLGYGSAFSTICELMMLTGMICLAVSSFRRGSRIPGIAGFALYSLACLAVMLYNFIHGAQVRYLIETFLYSVAFCLSLVFMIIKGDSGLSKGGAASALRKLWFLPAAITSVCLIIHICIGVSVFLDNGFFGYAVVNMVNDVNIIAFFLAFNLMHKMYPEGFDSSRNSSSRPSYASCYGSFNLIGHVFLLIFTFGIWFFIWIYRVTEYTNFTSRAERRDPAAKLLLCMFVPFYLIYWIYRSFQRIDLMCEENELPSDTDVFCTVMMFVAPIASLAIMQMKINDINSARVLSGAGAYSFQQSLYLSPQFQNSQNDPDDYSEQPSQDESDQGNNHSC